MGFSGHVVISKERGTSFNHVNFISVVLSFDFWGSILLLVDILSELTSLDELFIFLFQLLAIIYLMTMVLMVPVVFRVVPLLIRGLHLFQFRQVSSNLGIDFS